MIRNIIIVEKNNSLNIIEKISFNTQKQESVKEANSRLEKYNAYIINRSYTQFGNFFDHCFIRDGLKEYPLRLRDYYIRI